MSEQSGAEQKISQLQMFEQGLQSFLQQKQQFQSQMMEIESALEELTGAKEAYKIVGNIMVRTDGDELQKDLSSKKEMLEIRIKAIEKQETQLKDKAKKLQEEVLLQMKK
jgi:prefoldin beta subunit